jgi:hypothetical protein
MARRPVTVNDILDGHVSLDLECLDRLYLNGYVPTLQASGQVVGFLTHHLGFPIPSPAVVNRLGEKFRAAVATFAKVNQIPVVRFGKGDRKVEVMRPHLDRAAAAGVSVVAAIGVAQEFTMAWTATGTPRSGAAPGSAPWFSWYRAERRVTCYYFYVWDVGFGAAFIKVCAYFPYPMKIWLNGHEWAKRQAVQAGIGFTALSNGFATAEDPAAVQEICDRLGPGAIRVFCERWWARLPLPLSAADRAAGYWWDVSMRQVEVSRTIVFDAPRNGRAFFEALIADNIDLGRPEHIEVIFDRRVPRATVKAAAASGHPFGTRVVTRGTQVTVNVNYRHSRVKQYLKDGRALRIETVVNDTTDLGVKRRLEHLDVLQAKARAVNARVLDTERVGQGCVLASPAFERIAQPSLVDGRRAPALRFGDPRVMALAGALAVFVATVTGVTNRSLRAQVTALLGVDYTMGQASYDLRRLRLKGLIERLPHSNTYVLTGDGQRFAVFYTKVYNRLLTPLMAADQPPAPLELRQALRVIDHTVTDYIDTARLPAA